MKHSAQPEVERPLSPARQAWLMLVVVAPMAACYPAIKAGLEFAPSLRFAGLRTLVGGLALLLSPCLPVGPDQSGGAIKRVESPRSNRCDRKIIVHG